MPCEEQEVPCVGARQVLQHPRHLTHYFANRRSAESYARYFLRTEGRQCEIREVVGESGQQYSAVLVDPA